MKLVTILGARPQFIKAGAISREILSRQIHNSDLQEIIIHTGQHYDGNMSDVFFEEMEIPKPTYNLKAGGGSHGSMTGHMLKKIEEVLVTETPDVVLVYGDTNSTLAGALAASKLGMPIAHVEAGLRSYNTAMPEEINRILTDRLSKFLFCPTETALNNLESEGVTNWVPTPHLEITGDVMLDVAQHYAASTYSHTGIPSDNFVLCTIHRAENTNDESKLKDIFSALECLAEDIDILIPLHPRTKKILESIGLEAKNINFIDPVGYLEMIWLLKNCKLVVTDSGGLQKEAFFFGKPCVTLREETEWVELIEEKVNVLTGSNQELIVESCKKFMNKSFLMSEKKLYGDGFAAKKIVDCLLES